MKRIISFLLGIVLALSLFTGCERKTTESSDKIKVLGTVFPPFDFAREIGGDMIEADMLMTPGTDSHSYSGDNPSDILKIANSDLFIYIGGESESLWVEKVLETVEKAYGKRPETLNLSEHCKLLEENSEGTVLKDGHSGLSFGEHGHDHDHGHDECAFDEHIWTSLHNAEKMAKAISDKLLEMDGKNRDYYENNFAAFQIKLRELDNRFKEMFENCENKALVFADRFPFAYFSHDYSLECYAAFGGCATENEPSPTTIASLMKIIEEKKASSVFYIETSKSSVPNALAKACGGETYLIHSCHTVTEKLLREGVTYLSLMEQNLDNFRKALSND